MFSDYDVLLCCSISYQGPMWPSIVVWSAAGRSTSDISWWYGSTKTMLRFSVPSNIMSIKSLARISSDLIKCIEGAPLLRLLVLRNRILHLHVVKPGNSTLLWLRASTKCRVVRGNIWNCLWWCSAEFSNYHNGMNKIGVGLDSSFNRIQSHRIVLFENGSRLSGASASILQSIGCSSPPSLELHTLLFIPIVSH